MKYRGRTRVVAGAAIAAVALVGLVGLVVGWGGGAVTSAQACVAGTTVTTVANAAVGRSAAAIAAEPLSPEEQEALIYLREEEKLAHDMYVVLYEKWGTRVFKNISASEARHTASVKSLLDTYGLTDPVGSNAIGVFDNEELQELFDTLVSQGSVSKAAALQVGVAIETKDIEDLERLIALTTHSDIEQVAQNLLDGSQESSGRLQQEPLRISACSSLSLGGQIGEDAVREQFRTPR